MTAGSDTVQPVLPAYDGGGLAGVLPSVAASLGVGTGPLDLAPARRAVVVLVDGLGMELLRQRKGHAPFLRALLAQARDLRAGFPSTTATSLGSFGTGLPPGAHGLTGYQVEIPGEGRLFNELSWEGGPDPRTWQPEPTVLQRTAAAGVATTMVAPAYFDGSGLTRAALRGAAFRAADALEDRVDATLSAVRKDSRALVYLYWGELDRTGHVHGCQSRQWGEELEHIDRELRRLSDRLPRDCSLTVVADHGMIDIPMDARIDVAHDGELASGVRLVGGEMRALQLYCEQGAAADVLATWRGRLGASGWILAREEAVGQGWFGPVHERVMPRIGDVVVAFHEPVGVVDSRVMRPVVLGLLGQHGSLTPEEQNVPMLHLDAPDQR
ncbi:alkaline phosphatase family protein [Luteipulveratus sp. YIM 133132]|uniref:alkaline phosphatase family protein n=1 Tax=Luteipulveratus flavus TaxID=3031728 RepID=UPI0023B12A90|nr:nucleotide pyrophosphatase/phosphodiesterase family protein [Luteipulveratus sp. YIM 133132]MDE9366797.1 alkaline phosphatase family protein [Luteipulveratus sp. YIM 133132]